jgi:hypothetical protein
MMDPEMRAVTEKIKKMFLITVPVGAIVLLLALYFVVELELLFAVGITAAYVVLETFMIWGILRPASGPLVSDR